MNSASELLNQPTTPSLDQLNSDPTVPVANQLTDQVEPVTPPTPSMPVVEPVAPTMPENNLGDLNESATPEPAVTSTPTFSTPTMPSSAPATEISSMSNSTQTNQTTEDIFQKNNQDLIDQAVKEINEEANAEVSASNESTHLPPSMNTSTGGQRVINPISSDLLQPKTDTTTSDFDPNNIAL